MVTAQTADSERSEARHMDSHPGRQVTPLPPSPPSGPRSALRRGLSAAGAAVVVAFVGTAGLGTAQANAAGIATGPSYAARPGARQTHPPHPRHHADRPANLPAATTTAHRYSFRAGQITPL